MARKKREPSDEAPKQRKSDRPAGSRPSTHRLPERREGPSPSTARALVHQALDEPDEERRVALAQEALAIDANCADAYLLLAEAAPRRKEALALYEQALAAGERALGGVKLRELAGRFWDVAETRPYMRARLGVAHALWTSGRRDEAIAHLQALLDLNPNDNQGVRTTLASWLLFLDRDDDVSKLLQRYERDGSAAWAYTAALLAFRRQGDTLEARRLLKQAKKVNKYVPEYVLSREMPPELLPPSVTPGARTEAILCVSEFLSSWKFTPGAVAWMRAHDQSARRKSAEPEAKGPSAEAIKSLKRLAASGEVWQGDYRQLDNWIEFDGGRARPWLLLLADRDQGFALGHDVSHAAPTPERLWDTLAQTMRHPMAGRPRLPAELHVRADACWEALRPHLDALGVALVAGQSLTRTDEMLGEIGTQLTGPPLPGLLDATGVTAEQGAALFAAAALFFRQMPWKKVGYEAPIRIVSDRFPKGPRYGVLMGQNGLTAGLALYENLASLRELMTGEAMADQSVSRSIATVVTFGEESELPVGDLDAARERGWEVARDDAYPWIFHSSGGTEMEPPQPDAVDLMAASLRAVPEFVARRPQDDPTAETIAVPGPAGETRVTLSWVPQS